MRGACGCRRRRARRASAGLVAEASARGAVDRLARRRPAALGAASELEARDHGDASLRQVAPLMRRKAEKRGGRPGPPLVGELMKPSRLLPMLGVAAALAAL